MEKNICTVFSNRFLSLVNPELQGKSICYDVKKSIKHLGVDMNSFRQPVFKVEARVRKPSAESKQYSEKLVEFCICTTLGGA